MPPHRPKLKRTVILAVEVRIPRDENPTDLDGVLDAIAGESDGASFDFRGRVRERVYAFYTRKAAETVAATIRDRLKDMGRIRGATVTVTRARADGRA